MLKKAIFTIISLCVLILMPAAAFAGAPSLNLSTDGYNNNYPDIGNVDCGDTGTFWGIYDTTYDHLTINPIGSGLTCPGQFGGFLNLPSYTFSSDASPIPPGTKLELLILTDATFPDACGGATEQQCKDASNGTYFTIPFWFTDLGFSLTRWPASPQDWLDTASTTFSSTTGFDIGGTVSFAAATFYSIVLGSGLLMYKVLIPWIIAIAIIATIIYFLFRAFKYFRH